jgi:hypothetical protein
MSFFAQKVEIFFKNAIFFKNFAAFNKNFIGEGDTLRSGSCLM